MHAACGMTLAAQSATHNACGMRHKLAVGYSLFNRSCGVESPNSTRKNYFFGLHPTAERSDARVGSLSSYIGEVKCVTHLACGMRLAGMIN